MTHGSLTDMRNAKPTRIDLMLAEVCRNCLVCRRARQQQRGLAFWLVRKVEVRLCPFCRAYERVYGRRAHAKITPSAQRPLSPEKA
jgi:hypothetical protein